MRKWGALAIGGVLLISLATPVNAAGPKAGATCTKKNATATSAGKLYTCILSGKKLVWNKGVAIPAKPAAPTSETKTADTTNPLSKDSRITSALSLTSVENCKTTDLTPYFTRAGMKFFQNGFPRPSESLAGKKGAKLLVIPFSYRDLPFRTDKYQIGNRTTSDYEVLLEAIPQVEDAFKKLSLNKFELKIDVLPQSKWLDFNEENPFSRTWGVDNLGKFLYTLQTKEPNFKFDGYDGYVFTGGHGNNGLQSFGSAQGTFAEKMENSQSGFINSVFMIGGFSQIPVWVHELGHALFGLEDLYLFSDSGQSRTKTEDVPLQWDLMASVNKLVLLQWNRMLMGWLDDSEVRCISDQKTTVHYLSEYNSTKDPKVLTINLVPGVTLVAEPRTSGNSVQGLLLYTINTYVAHGQGPIISQNQLIEKGKSRSLYGWNLEVIDSNASGLLVSVEKTDISKFVPPAQIPAPQQASPQSTKINVMRGDIVSDGFLKGKATWVITGQESYRLYVTEADDYQKVYFESGYVNDNRNPLVVSITGLPCNKDLRTVTEFYTKPNGEGERVVMESRQLTKLSCDDTTKKP